MTGRRRTISRSGFVRAAEEGCVTIEVGVPCGGCRNAGCISRQPAPQLRLPGPPLGPGDRVELALAAGRLTRMSMALFGPPLVWLLLLGWLASDPAIGSALAASATTALCAGVGGMAIALSVGVWLGRQQADHLKIDVIPLKSLPAEAAEV